MTDEEIEQHRQELTGLLDSNLPVQEKLEKLHKLARRVGASIYFWDSMGGQKEGNESVIAHNIHYALNTSAMINAAQSAAYNCRIGYRLTKAAIATATAAIISALCAIFAVIKSS